MAQPPAPTLSELVDRCSSGATVVRSLASDIVQASSPIATRAARALNLDTHDAEEVAEFASTKLVQMLERGERPRGSAEALVWRMAENRSRDLHRARRRRADGKERLAQELEAASATSSDPETLWLSRERQAWAQTVVREALEEAPKTYRVAIRRHYLEGIPIEALADEHYAEMLAAGDVDEQDPTSVRSAEKKARNRADQHLKRGRDWLRRRLAKCLDEDEP